MPLSYLLTFFLVFHSCNKQENLSQTETPVKPSITAVDVNKAAVIWGRNDEEYLKTIHKNAKQLKGFRSSRNAEDDGDLGELPNPCSTTRGNTWGMYVDPEYLVVSGPYNSASTTNHETFYRKCTTISSAISSAKDYLNNEGYTDIVALLDTPEERYKLVHAANALLELKGTFAATSNPNTRVANCIFQALGYTALAELGANWASGSRQVLLRAIGKVATRYLGWFGAGIALVSFSDCMWG